MTDEDRLAIANQQRLLLLSLRKEKRAVFHHLYLLEAREEELARTFRERFPTLDFEQAPANWDDLTNADRATLNFVARHGHVRRVAEAVHAYTVETGDQITLAAFKMRLSRLREKRVLLRGYHGWSVAPEIFETALHPPQIPVVLEGPEAGFERLAARLRAAKHNALKPRFKIR